MRLSPVLGVLFALVASSPLGVLSTPVPEADADANAAITMIPIPPPENITAVALEGRGAPLSKRSFWATCSDCFYYFAPTIVCPRRESTVLRCQCRNGAGQMVQTDLDLGTCLRNDDGNLQWWRNGCFGDTCDASSAVPLARPPELAVQCRRTIIGTKISRINLDERVHNWNGQLGCDV